jgi:deazaflavin-dependent oxidoreductase (nitroreductase family)
MASFARTPKFMLKLIRWPPRIAYALGLGPLIGGVILLLTTTGRKTGRPRVTPLQYELIDGAFYLGASLGRRADWYRNILAHPAVEVRTGSRRLAGVAETITDPGRIADFLELRWRRHPRFMGAILHSEGMRLPPERADLERYAASLALVVVRPLPDV